MRTAPLLSPWPGPFGGVPPFDKIKTKDFTPALEAGMEQTRKDIAAIAGAKEPATFENTIAAYEDAGRAFGRVASVFGTYSVTMNRRPRSRPRLTRAAVGHVVRTADIESDIASDKSRTDSI